MLQLPLLFLLLLLLILSGLIVAYFNVVGCWLLTPPNSALSPRGLIVEFQYSVPPHRWLFQGIDGSGVVILRWGMWRVVLLVVKNKIFYKKNEGRWIIKWPSGKLTIHFQSPYFAPPVVDGFEGISAVGQDWGLVWGGWQAFAREEAWQKLLVSSSKHYAKMMLVVKISPSFFVHHRPSINARGCGGWRGRGMAVRQVENDAMTGKWGEFISCVR
jgi:hypothetical protein